ncbi:MAG TPA: universal stress protein [Bacteroidia bacterium]|nr:universal stress protein [Bacteroidia bacterium]
MKQLKLLLATDYSDEVMNAERYAIQIAKETNATLTLIHVYPVPLILPSDDIVYINNIDELHLFELKRLEEHKEELFQSLNLRQEELQCECVVREGNIALEICKEAEESLADFIIVGIHSVSGLRETFLGSHFWDVIKQSVTPVFAVPKDGLFTGIKNIVFGTSYREEEWGALEFVVGFAKKFNANLTVVHITNYMLSKELERTMFEEFRDKVEERLPYSKLKIHLLVKDSIVEGLNQYCIENKTDLISLSLIKENLIDKIFLSTLSLTRKMSFHSDTPLLIVPPFPKSRYIEKELHTKIAIPHSLYKNDFSLMLNHSRMYFPVFCSF